VIDATVVVEPRLVAAAARVEGLEHEKDYVDEQLTLDASASAMVQNPSAKI
jgi:hypothetical protein